jgi:hypothetical protein
VDAGAARGTGGVEGAAWGATEVVGTTRGGSRGRRSRRWRSYIGSGGRTASLCSGRGLTAQTCGECAHFTVLRRSVGTRHPQKYPFGGEECARGAVIKLTAIVALDGFDGVAKLCGDISGFFWQSEKCLI